VTKDLDLVEQLRQALARPVTDEQAQAARQKILRDALLTVLVLVAMALLYWMQDRRTALLLPAFLAVKLGWDVVARYHAARARPGAPVPDDVLAGAVRDHLRCRECRTIVRRGAFTCPSCGVPLWITPGFLVALVIGVSALAILLWWGLVRQL
jgi:hypothetical protein